MYNMKSKVFYSSQKTKNIGISEFPITLISKAAALHWCFSNPNLESPLVHSDKKLGL